MGLEGELRVAVHLAGARVAGCTITSTRPDVAAGLLQGREAGDIALAVPRLFSICGASQGVACELALAAAAGRAPDGARLARCSATVVAETLRETARRVLLDWPRFLGEAPGAEAIAAARAAGAVEVTAAQRDGVARAVFGETATAWLAHDSPAALRAWAEAGGTAAARFIGVALREPTATARQVPLLPSPPTAAWLRELAAEAEADPAFARHPVWHGAAAETGALARQQGDALVAALLLAASGGSRVAARHAARLRELARLLAGHQPVAAGALALATDEGLGWVDNTRGLLVHHARLQAGRAMRYRIVAPTEWNFHPAGALAASLAAGAAGDAAALRRRVAGLVDSLDPCVSCRIEIDDA
jgi:coenzyme F420-reducing hydrogenase alpha subunit